mmetsp:Transcript_9374/g.40710  ORF Transcript_9374/g.40710 Transcript_9374/m.40710 type:complete len:352 (-) Transcript_9374:400-1455(-)|eukprot:CAMPEP_0113967318 /NCGR_PEP_ID=MMETSP0011_2-20120614/8858_1 /TAXON_ID=101924 /ORGANISM="Rhodosorus marinus" /LENGTH=351 /DNA_ID=CAMNT_0000980177 /DNA_START=49 /DNA_END=1104 /DNA_ORIENTATION=+ /assembly_acc=CAM_ASM_000156
MFGGTLVLGFSLNMGMLSKEQVENRRLCLLVRHGQTDWNSQGRVQGQIDESRLLPKGEEQARMVGRYLKGVQFDKVYSSPLNRARRTSEIALKEMSGRLTKDDINFMDELKEIRLPWQGMFKSDILSKYPEYETYHNSPAELEVDGFTPVHDLHVQSEAAWTKILSSDFDRCLVIAHNQTNRALLGKAMGLPVSRHHSFSQDNCCFNLIESRNGNLQLLWSNVSHDGVYVPTKKPPKDRVRLEMQCIAGLEAILKIDGEEYNFEGGSSSELLDRVQTSSSRHAVLIGGSLSDLCAEMMQIPSLKLCDGGVASILLRRNDPSFCPHLEVFCASKDAMNLVERPTGMQSPAFL